MAATVHGIHERVIREYVDAIGDFREQQRRFAAIKVDEFEAADKMDIYVQLHAAMRAQARLMHAYHRMRHYRILK